MVIRDDAPITTLQELINEALAICDEHGLADLAVRLTAAHEALVPYFERAGLDDAIVRIPPPGWR